jgi:uncharacterized lipoprotein YmbA
MRTRMLRSGLLLFAAVAVGLGGCLGGTSAPTRFYTLVPVVTPLAGTLAKPGLSVGIGPVAIPAYLDRPQIVTRQGSEELSLAEFNYWAEPLKTGVPRVLADNLTVFLGTDRVSLFPWAKAPAGQVQVVVDVTRFEGVTGKEVVLNARWRILGSDGTELVVRQAAITEATGGAGYDALVAAMSRALSTLSRDVAAAVRDLPK